MFSFSNAQISIATPADVPSIKSLLNAAYRGEDSKQGWTTEAYLIGGEQRTNEDQLLQTMQLPGSVFLKYNNEQNEIIGCVNLQQHHQKLYLGMFAVNPFLQSGGMGKQLLQSAEEYARHLPCTAIYMSVISVRDELINWYKRHGYKETGERKIFFEDDITGNHLQPLEFMMMEKEIVKEA